MSRGASHLWTCSGGCSPERGFSRGASHLWTFSGGDERTKAEIIMTCVFARGFKMGVHGQGWMWMIKGRPVKMNALVHIEALKHDMYRYVEP